VSLSKRAVFVVVGLLFLSACGAYDKTGGDHEIGPSSPPPDWFVDQRVLPADLEDVLVADLGGQLGDESDVVASGSSLVTWIRSGLGCPLETEQSTPDSVDGYLVYFNSGGDWYRAHVAANGRYRFCDAPDSVDDVLIPVLER